MTRNIDVPVREIFPSGGEAATELDSVGWVLGAHTCMHMHLGMGMGMGMWRFAMLSAQSGLASSWVS